MNHYCHRVTPGSALGQYLIAAALFSVLDALWLGVLARDYYRDQRTDPLTDPAGRTSVVIYYALLIGVLVRAVIYPAIAEDDLFFAVAAGAVSGMVAFAVWGAYNMTRRTYPRQLFLVETGWGGVLCAVVSGGTFTVWQWF